MGPRTHRPFHPRSLWRGRVNANWLMVPVFAAFAVVPWLYPGNFALKLGFSLCQLSITIMLLHDRALRVNASCADRGDELRKTPELVLSLTGRREQASPAAATEYEIVARSSDEGKLPERVVSRAPCPLLALQPLVDKLDLDRVKVIAGWGLDQQGLDILLRRAKEYGHARVSPSSKRGVVGVNASGRAGWSTLQAPVFPKQHTVAWALVFGSAFVATVTTILFAKRFGQGLSIHWLSWLMPSVAIFLALVLALITRFNNFAVHFGGCLVFERRILGFVLWRQRAEPFELVGAWGVSPDGGLPLHLVIATKSGLFATRCFGAGAQRIVHALRDCLATTAR